MLPNVRRASAHVGNARWVLRDHFFLNIPPPPPN